MDINDILIKPLLTEKSVGLREGGFYVFLVNKKANKIMIKSAVEKVFKIKVLSCKVCNYKPQEKFFRHTRNKGQKASYKKAMIKISKGEKIASLEA